MKLGIVGLPNVGKSTLFNSLTKAGAESANYPFCTIDPNVGIVAVPDERLDKLTEMYNSAKTTPAVIEFVDIAGLVKGASKGEGLGNQFQQVPVQRIIKGLEPRKLAFGNVPCHRRFALSTGHCLTENHADAHFSVAGQEFSFVIAE